MPTNADARGGRGTMVGQRWTEIESRGRKVEMPTQMETLRHKWTKNESAGGDAEMETP